VFLHIGTRLNVTGDYLYINRNGDATDLQIYMHENAVIDTGDYLELAATILSPAGGDLKFGRYLQFQGLIHSAGKIELDDRAELTYSNSQQSAIAALSICQAGGGGPDHFVVGHDGSGAYCQAEPVTVTATDNAGNVMTDYTGSIILDSSSSRGTWALTTGAGSFADATADDGLATYTFATSDQGAATFALTYTNGTPALDIDVWESGNTSLRDDDTEGDLVYSSKGFTFTASAVADPPPSPINDPLGNQIAGNSFTAHLNALTGSTPGSSCGVVTSYNGTKTLSFWVEYVNPSTGTVVPTVNGVSAGTSEAMAVTQTVTFNNGRAVLSVKYKDVGMIILHAKDNAISGTSNQFVVTPADFSLVSITDSAGTANPGATTATGTGFVAAGENFSVVVQVLDAEGSLTPNYGQETPAEGVEITAASLLVPAAGRNGSANDGAIANGASFTATTSAGEFSSNVLSWDETGIIRLQASVADDDYLGAGEISGNLSGPVGRFTPASYVLTTGAVTAACNGFTYMGQPALRLSWQLEAQGTAGNRLYNYDAGLLGAGAVATVALQAENNNDGVELASRIPGLTASWINGGFSAGPADTSFSRAVSPDGPFDSLLIGVRVSDTLDSVALSGTDMNSATSTDCSSIGNCTAKALGTATMVRFGRIAVNNAFGPETEPLDVTLKSQFWNGTEFVTHALDNCSSYVNSSATLGNYQGGLPALTVIAPVSVTTLNSGVSLPGQALILSAPGSGNDGSVDVTLTVDTWLRYPWTGGGAVNPTGTAGFGHFRGHDRVIYWREVLN
ncbi:MAG: hypothetical protein KDK91_34470, partial [Gammaproteobacteria bacterium]|nr:hypothetical protein [Gammaproteobacteria bacterium]